MATVLEPTTRKRRKWLRWALLLSLLLLLAIGGGFWWLTQPPPLTAEEQRFVGIWELPSPHQTGSVPYETVAHEFRADRKVIYHRRDPRTGTYYTEDMGIRWRANEDTFFYRFRNPDLVLGRFSKPMELEMKVAWEDPDRIHLSTAHHGPAGPAVDHFKRRPAP